jgi:hypothetical protein
MRARAICVLAGCALIALSSCVSKTSKEIAKSQAAEQDFLASKTEVVRLTEFPGDLEPGKKLQPQDQNQEVEICGALSGGVSASQRLALNEFVANEKEIFRAVREAIYRHYRENYLPHRDKLRRALEETAKINGIRPEGIERVMDGFPEIKTGHELDSLVALIAISVHRPVNGVSKIGILFQCRWERDEGLGVRIAGSAVEAIGTGEVAHSE